jgi:hypothetical protein
LRCFAYCFATGAKNAKEMTMNFQKKIRKIRILSKEKFLEILSFSIEMSENKFVLKNFKTNLFSKNFIEIIF